MMGNPIRKSRRPLGIGEHLGAFTESQVRGDRNGNSLVKFGQKMGKELSAVL